ncbi:MAG: GNAT family N-acetyltransferase [Alphaproteobacteria bacterium]|nr:GNAT family N-acetyltransferase [Alphaproteobacteria bacterium]
MVAGSAAGLRFTLDLPSRTEPRHFKVRPVAEGEGGATDELISHAPGVTRHRPPATSTAATTLRLGAFDDLRVLRALLDLHLGAPSADCAFVELFVVEPRYRNAGLGTAMFTELARRLKDAGARRIQLEVDHDNPNAARFWKRLGFAETGTGARLQLEKRL